MKLQITINREKRILNSNNGNAGGKTAVPLKRSAVRQNKLLRARIVIKIRIAGSGSNK